ncbi:hypothetical protein G6F70_001903 [Rhizopus microsporus]|uniref:ubiquitinyl hydrolase 1 n=2 Tax=Rhizopus TaxID=4842 RepID=A0A367J6K4_RHIAZ|nr:hypothetical protein G6F71_006521 [Rhizopus microsporus]RCH85584.1 hypothetical protein CU097_004731 [Rhizopus azygosporus]KAG1202816.1 hypothetical protein G6F70_001903 [Rhizopus microsporus]KAG1209357.1 hypothetical protein G6F69_006434 [Rhizopus microsporus]KAG1230802.1 hypothetical protein G6F67_006200 [Rhizopus microsporus]
MVVNATNDKIVISTKENELTAEKKPSVLDEETMLKTLLPKNNDLETEETGVFHWHIKDWKGLEDKCHGPVFHVKGFPWRILLFPRGNNQKKSFSFYLEVADPKDGTLPEGWHVCAQFALAVSNPTDPTLYYSSHANHRFSADEIDWGFTRFYEIEDLDKMTSKAGPFLVDNEIVLSVFIRVVKDETGVLWHNFVNYDSRKETGFVGIKNQGATCYMNSLLQSLYCTNKFRKAVYDIPTDNDEPTKSVALALQRCFYNLQYSSAPVGTTELTKSFGWDTLDAFMQHDVQEFNRVLQDNLEEKMKGTPADGAISKLFQGKTKSYIKCINVDFESSRVEDYYDIQLNVKGCKDLQDSFDDYVAEEILEGDNKYMAEEHGLQDAKKGVIFEDFPPVLHLQLKRFEYDFMRDTMVKINDRHEFPPEINLDKYCSNSDKDGPYDYQLHGVLVHSGDVSGGHYFALIRPSKEDKWFRFDDDRVTPASKKEVFEENYGDEPLRDSKDLLSPTFNSRINSARMMKKFTNAYMLVYIRKSKLDDILDPVLESDIPVHLKRRLDDEKAMIEKRKKERQDMQHNVKVAVITDDSLKDYQGFNLAVFDDRYLEVSPHVEVFKAPKIEKVSEFKKQLMDHYKLEANQLRLWYIQTRQNKTNRVTQCLTSAEDKLPLEKLKELTCGSAFNNGLTKLYLEKSEKDKPLPSLRNDQVLLFVKYFDVKEQKLRGLGHMFVSLNDKIASILSNLNERAGLKKSTSIQLFEEVKPLSIEPIKTDQTFRKIDIQHGDIICFQISLSQREMDDLSKKGYITTAPDYYASLYNRSFVLFKPLPSTQHKQEAKLVLNRHSSYTAVAQELAKEIGANPNRIRFTSSHPITHQPREVIAYKPTTKLEEMIPNLPKPADYQQFVSFEKMNTPILFYETLEVDLADLESKRSIEVSVLGPTLRRETKVTALVSRAGTVRQLLDQVIAKSKMEVKDPAKIRLYEAVDSKLTKEFSLEQPVDNVATEKNAIVYAEPIPKDELEMNLDTDRLVQVVHYHNKPTELHSAPFRFVAIKGETFEETKKRLQKRTGLGDMDWKKVKFTVIRNIYSPEPQVEPIDANDFELRKARLQEEDALGLDHVDKSSKSRFTHVFDKGIFIRG